jgi:hypothetical protein
MKIAREKGLPELKHHILPRTKGFTLLLQGAENRSKFISDLFRILEDNSHVLTLFFFSSIRL